MSTYVTSDHHFGHAGALGLYRRPFESVAEMDRQMIGHWNLMVRPEDEIWHLGNFAIRQRPVGVAFLLTRLHQLNAIFAIFGASDRDKSLDLKGRGLRNRLWCRPSSLRGRGRGASLRHVFALQDSPQGRQGTSRMVGCRKPAR